MAKSAPRQPEQPPVKNRTLVLTAAGYRATDPPPGRRPVTVLQEFSRQFGEVNDLLVAAIEILTGIGYTVGDAAIEVASRIHVVTAMAHARAREDRREANG